MRRSLLIVFFFLQSTLGYALEQKENTFGHDVIQKKKKPDKMNFYATGTFASISSATGESLSGPGFSAWASYALTDKTALGIGAGTLLGGLGAAAATILTASFTYSLTGNMVSNHYDYLIGDYTLASFSESKRQGFRVQGLLSQYYFNGTQNTLPFGGMGFAVYYERYLGFLGQTALAGFRYDMLFNNDESITPMTVFFGVSF